MDRTISRKCDMGEPYKLKLLIEEDGDVIVSVLGIEDRVSFKSVEFCTSGTQSPKTTRALHELYKAMKEDEEKRPQEL